MKIVLLASALALATVSFSPAFAESLGTQVENGIHLAERTTLVISEAQIARFKTALNLTRAQEQLWAPVERSARAYANRPAAEAAAAGFRSRFAAFFHVVLTRALMRLADLRARCSESRRRAEAEGPVLARTMGMSMASVFYHREPCPEGLTIILR